ncbi:Outer membrane efflux protein [Planctomycetes bacterium Pan216]|uniref:Outer membrane efflux protein n=1 Tax=Kolteria novifilia TaxID=2527975 RepID=A0A518B7W2_9BACT|nr:Outer membrane efflux protein [Planctomycetes bacterium Pan216]
MRKAALDKWFLIGLIGAAGCAKPHVAAWHQDERQVTAPIESLATDERLDAQVHPVRYTPSSPDRPSLDESTVATTTPKVDEPATPPHLLPIQAEVPMVEEATPQPFDSELDFGPTVPGAGTIPGEPFAINLPTAMAHVSGGHPIVGTTQWQVREAYARLAQARVLWLPTIQPGFSFNVHDGNLQTSEGEIIDVNRDAFQAGLGSGATGAGTTTFPGLLSEFHVADAIFLPRIAARNACALEHGADATVNEHLLGVALAYLQLQRAEQDRRIVEETHDHTATLSKLTHDFAAAGQGLRADADRLQTELTLVKSRLVGASEQTEVAAADLAEAISLDNNRRLLLMEPTIVPLDLVPGELDEASLISEGLSNRPELKESQALVAAACEEFRRQKAAPFVPSLLLGFSPGVFGGGRSGTLANIDNRADFDAVAFWQVRQLGLGEKFARRESKARVQQARYEVVGVMDQVARQIRTARTQVVHRKRQIEITKQAITSAEASFERNLARIRDGQGLPLEVLQSVQALESARRAYLNAVIDYNRAQFTLQWALGWPVHHVNPGEG